MTNLISGKEALIALANGEEVEYSHEEEPYGRWTTISSFGEYSLDCFLAKNTKFKFRIKPRTITINGIEVPCCGKDYQYGDAMYILNSLEPAEYSMIVLDKVDEVPLYWWRTEEEIKQVVAALRIAFFHA